MERLVTMSVIRGEGECEVIINHVVQKEIQRLQAMNRKKYEDEMKKMKHRLSESERKRRAMLQARLNAIDARMSVPVTFRERMRFKIPYGWAWCVATVMSVKARFKGQRL